MFGRRRKKTTIQTIEAAKMPLAALQRYYGLPPHFWTDEFVLGFFGYLIAYFSDIASMGKLSQIEKGQLLSDVFSALSHMNGQALSAQFTDLVHASPASQDFVTGGDNAHICVNAAMYGKTTEDGLVYVERARKMAVEQGLEEKPGAIEANLMTLLFLDPVKERFALNEHT